MSESLDPYRIAGVSAWAIDIPLTDSFVVSQGSVNSAQNVFVSVRLAGGVVGYGEAAPFRALTGEDQGGTIAAVEALRPLLVGRSVLNSARLSDMILEAAREAAAARAALECAIVDALCRVAGLPLWAYWGGAGKLEYTTDVTLPILEDARMMQLAGQWYSRGFRTFKLKIGADIDRDMRLIERLAALHPDTSFVLDANQGFTLDETRRFVIALRSHVARVKFLEQPVDRDDLEGMAALVRDASVSVVADESVLTAEQARRIIQARAADCINLKIMKSGLFETIRIAGIVRGAGLQLMIGGMVESRLAMGFSLGLAAGLGCIEHFDLDTPLLMSEDPVSGGYTYEGSVMCLGVTPGVGSKPAQLPS